MKNFAFLISLLLTTNWVSAQNRSYQFLYENAPMISTLAHPTTEYRSHKLYHDGNDVQLYISYYNAFSEVSHTLKLKFRLNSSGAPDYMGVIDDSALFPPFAATELIKDFVVTKLKETIEEEAESSGDGLTYTQRALLNKLESAAVNLSGIEFALLLLKFQWESY